MRNDTFICILSFVLIFVTAGLAVGAICYNIILSIPSALCFCTLILIASLCALLDKEDDDEE